MISLKAFLPILANNTGLSVSTLYERQRALVRLGLLPTPVGRGPGSGGAMATPATVSVMLLSVLVTDSLSGVDERLYDWMGLRAQHMSWETGKLKDGHCEITGQRTLFRSMQAILAGRGNATIPKITVQRQTMFVKLTDVEPDNHSETWFGSYLNSQNGIVHNVEFSRLFDLQCELEILHDGNRS